MLQVTLHRSVIAFRLSYCLFFPSLSLSELANGAAEDTIVNNITMAACNIFMIPSFQLEQNLFIAYTLPREKPY